MCFHDLSAAPLAGTPVEYLALLDEVMHRPDHFFNGYVRVGTMAEEQVEIVELQALQCFMAGLEHMLAAQTGLVGLVRITPPEIDLTGYHVGTPVPVLCLQHTTHHQFTLAVGITFRIIEEVDARVVCEPHQPVGRVVFNLFVECHPAAIRKDTQLKAGAAHVPVFHRRSFVYGYFPKLNIVDENLFDSRTVNSQRTELTGATVLPALSVGVPSPPSCTRRMLLVMLKIVKVLKS